MELAPAHVALLERLFAAGFRPIAIPPYERALCVHRGEYAALLGPAGDGALQLLAPVTVLVDGNLSVRLKKPSGDVFAWKGTEVPANAERLHQLQQFRNELMEILQGPGAQATPGRTP